MTESSPHHPFKARFYSGLILLLLAVVGLILTDVRKDGGFGYWRIATPVFAILPLFLSWYLRRNKESYSVAYIWHEVLHWTALLASIFLVTELVRIGLLNRFAASLVMLILLAFSFFLAGIYIEFTFLLLGLVLGAFVILVAFLAEYLYFITVPLVLIAIVLLFLLCKKRKKHHREID